MKIQKQCIAIATTVGFAFAGLSGAQAEEGFYVGGAFGKAWLDENIGGFLIDSDSSTYRIFGGYGITPYLGVEVAYWDLGTFRETIDVGGTPVPVAVSADGFSLAGVGTIPLSERLSLKARLGFYFHDGNSEVGGIIDRNPAEANPFVGLGLAFSLNEKLALDFGVDYLNTKDADPVMAMAGLTFRF